MTSKQYIVVLGALLLTISFTASGQDRVWADSSYYKSRQLAQYNEFRNNLYAFPPKPRNMLEVGIKTGTPIVGGDVSAVFPTFGWGIHVRKALGYTVSLRGEFFSGTARGLNWQTSTNYMKNKAWAGNGYLGDQITASGDRLQARDKIFYNYQAKIMDLSLQAVFSFNNIRFHTAKTKFNAYVFGGLGIAGYETMVNALNGSSRYNFNTIASGTYETRKDVRQRLNDLLDDSYETPAEAGAETTFRFMGRNGRVTATGGVGIAFRLSRKLNIAIEDRITLMRDDAIDGMRWSEQPQGDASMTRSFDALNFLSLGLNLNLF